MNLQSISLAPIRQTKVAIIGYGNQGRAHALNLRDSGVTVLVGARPGKNAALQAAKDGFEPYLIPEAAARADVVMLLLPDQEIPKVYDSLKYVLPGKKVGFAHGFAYHFKLIERFANTSYFIVTPKGAGALLRKNFELGGGLPAVFALDDPKNDELRTLAASYAKAIGGATSFLGETTFAEETECDLFGEQAVLCGGIMQLMEMAFQTLVKNGHSETMAFFECCFEARLITELWMKYGPAGMSERISPTAFFGGITRGKRLVDERTRAEMEKIFAEIRGGEFAREWMNEVANGMPQLKAAREELRNSELEKIYRQLPEEIR